MKTYEKKKKELAEKGMPNPKIKKNVTEEDREAEMGEKCGKCGSMKHKTKGHK